MCCECLLIVTTLPASYQARDETGESQDQEDHEQDLRDTHGTGGDATESEQRGDQGNDQEDDGVVQHWTTPSKPSTHGTQAIRACG